MPYPHMQQAQIALPRAPAWLFWVWCKTVTKLGVLALPALPAKPRSEKLIGDLLVRQVGVFEVLRFRNNEYCGDKSMGK